MPSLKKPPTERRLAACLPAYCFLAQRACFMFYAPPSGEPISTRMKLTVKRRPVACLVVWLLACLVACFPPCLAVQRPGSLVARRPVLGLLSGGGFVALLLSFSAVLLPGQL